MTQQLILINHFCISEHSSTFVEMRQFRKELRENRKKIASGTEIAKELNNKIMTDFSKRRIEYDRETKYGTDLTKQKEWENQIQKELLLLKDFSYEN